MKEMQMKCKKCGRETELEFSGPEYENIKGFCSNCRTHTRSTRKAEGMMSEKQFKVLVNAGMKVTRNMDRIEASAEIGKILRQKLQSIQTQVQERKQGWYAEDGSFHTE